MFQGTIGCTPNNVLPWFLAGVQPWDSWGLYITHEYPRDTGLI